MLSLDICKKILNKENKKYNDEEVKLIREFLYQLAELELENDDKKELDYE